MKIKCPSCKTEVEIQEQFLKYHPTGRQTNCPNCRKKIILRKYVRRPS